MSARKNPIIFIVVVIFVGVGAFIFLRTQEKPIKPNPTGPTQVQKVVEDQQSDEPTTQSHATETPLTIKNSQAVVQNLTTDSSNPPTIISEKNSPNQFAEITNIQVSQLETDTLSVTENIYSVDTIANEISSTADPFDISNSNLVPELADSHTNALDTNIHTEELITNSVSDEHPKFNAKTIVKMSDDLMRGDSSQGIYIMDIKTPSWSRTLELDVISQGRDKVFIRILSPSKEAGTGTLRIKNEMWNYLPRIEKVIKIPPSMMLQPWMGSDFANDDLVKENSIVEDYSHKIIAEETIRGHLTHKIEMIPNAESAVIWGKLYYWIRIDDNVPIQQEFYSEKNELVKRLEYSDIGQVSDRIIPRVWLMTNLLKDGKSTRIHLKDVSFNQPIDENLFTLSNLKRYN